MTFLPKTLNIHLVFNNVSAGLVGFENESVTDAFVIEFQKLKVPIAFTYLCSKLNEIMA
jgi:hypothetical protein